MSTIPKEAVEAAAKAVWQWWEENCASNSEAVTEEDRGVATAALEAAAPYLIREARAAELEAAADGWREHTRALGLGTTEPIRWLRARAAAIRAGAK